MLGGDLLLSAPPRPTPRPPIMDGQPPAVLMSAASARFFAIDWWLVPGYRLDGWAPMIVFDAARALDHAAAWWTSPAYLLDFRPPVVVLDVGGDRTLGA